MGGNECNGLIPPSILLGEEQAKEEEEEKREKVWNVKRKTRAQKERSS